jgi:hypothetical protein
MAFLAQLYWFHEPMINARKQFSHLAWLLSPESRKMPVVVAARAVIHRRRGATLLQSKSLEASGWVEIWSYQIISSLTYSLIRQDITFA